MLDKIAKIVGIIFSNPVQIHLYVLVKAIKPTIYSR